MVPGGRSAAAAAMSATASLPALRRRPPAPPTRSSANSDGLEQLGQLAGADLAGTQPVHRHVVGARLLARLPKDSGDRALDEQLFVTQHQVQACDLFAHSTIVSWPPDSPDTVHASRHNAAAPVAMRTHRHRHDSTAAIPAAATHTTPSRPDGTPTDAPGTPAAHRATRNSHHNSGPVNRISSCAPDGHSGHSAAAAGADDRDRRDHRGHGEVGDNRHHAEGARYPGNQRGGDELRGDGDAHRIGQRLGPAAPDQAPRPHRCDRRQAPAVAETDSANPTSTASSGAAIISTITLADNTGIACLRRCETTASSVMAPMTAARSTLADG